MQKFLAALQELYVKQAFVFRIITSSNHYSGLRKFFIHSQYKHFIVLTFGKRTFIEYLRAVRINN